MIVKCLSNGCRYEGEADEFPGCLSPYHDLRCPKCGTTNLDTSEVAKALSNYGYGDDNCLRMK